MAGNDNETVPTLSLLDRLTEKEGPLDSWQGLCRDLSALLNTRRADKDFDSSYEEATNSLLSFGVADFTSYNLKNEVDQEHVRRSIERAIRQFEPRLTHVIVSMDEPDQVKPILRFQIAAVLRFVDPGEQVLFDVTLHRDSRRIAVSGTSS